MSEHKEYYDVILVQPNIVWVYDPFEHLGLAYLAAILRKHNYKVKIVDAVIERITMSELYAVLDNYNIGVLGVTLISHGYLTTVKFLELYREKHPQTKVLTGGHFATFAHDKILQHTNVFDGIALGEGEFTLLEYCNNVLRGGNAPLKDIALPGREVEYSSSRILNMNELPFAARDYLPLAIKHGAIPSVTSSRGCSARCSFCTVHNFYRLKEGPSWISRSIDNILEELAIIHEQYKVNHFMFVDDNFIGPGPAGREKAMAFAEAYRNSGLPMTFHIDCRAVNVNEEIFDALVKAGLKSVFIGIESVSHQDLIYYRKGLKAEANWRAVEILKKFGLNYTLSMIMFNPLSTPESILDNISFLKDAGYYPRNPISVLNFYEGTDANKTFGEFIDGPFWDYKFRFKHEITANIYREALQFCKDSLPLERELSHRPDTAADARKEVARLRLLCLEDLAANIAREPAENITARWHKKLMILRSIFKSKAPLSSKASQFLEERLYLTGSQLDFEQPNVC